MAKMNKNANYVTDKTQVAQKQMAKAKSSQKAKEITKQVLIIVAIVLAVAAVVTGFVFWMKGISTVEDRDFKVPVPGAFEVTDVVEIEFEGYGTVKIELYGKEAPKTVENFKHLVEHGEITGDSITISSTTTNKYITIAPEHDHSDPDHEHNYIKGEFYDNGVANRISHVAGVLTMNTGSTKYNSSSTDFKILTGDYTDEKTGYNGNNAAFGKVIDGGLEIINKMIEDSRAKASSSSSTTVDEDELVFGSNKLTITATDIKNKTVEYKFKPTVSGKYTFKSSKFASINITKAGAEEGAKSAEFGTDITTIADGVEFELVKGEEYAVTFAFKDGASAGTFNVTIDADILFAGKNDIEITEEEAQAENVSFDYTANMTGMHFFTDKDKKLKDKIEIFDGETSLGKNSAYLEEGKKYTIIITTNKEVEADDYTITALEPTLVVGDNALEVPEYTIRDGKAYYYFTAEEDAKYLFTNKNLEFTVYDKDGNIVEGGNYVELVKGETYKIEITADLVPEIVLGANSIVITADDKVKDKAEYEKEFTFTAQSTGKYTFTANSITFKVYNGDKEVVAENGAVSLKAGKTYKVIAKTASEGTYPLELTVADATDTEKVVPTKSYTVTVQDPILATGTNKLTITQSDIDLKEVVYTFTATTNGPFSFKGIYQKLNDEGEQVKNEAGKLVNVNAVLKITDKDGNELDAEYAMLKKGETYKVTLKSDLIKPNAVATLTIAKVAPKIASAKVVE